MLASHLVAAGVLPVKIIIVVLAIGGVIFCGLPCGSS